MKLSKFLKEERKEFVISHQIYKSGTSIGANIAESNMHRASLIFSPS
jgi:four helix bundle protein